MASMLENLSQILQNLSDQLKLVTSLSCAQASITIQLHTRHISLNKCLYHIKQTNSPCPSCNVPTTETIQHLPTNKPNSNTLVAQIHPYNTLAQMNFWHTSLKHLIHHLTFPHMYYTPIYLFNTESLITTGLNQHPSIHTHTLCSMTNTAGLPLSR